MTFIQSSAFSPSPRVIVLLPADSASGVESRQIRLGADCVQRDPVRGDVLQAYIQKYVHAAQPVHTGSVVHETSFLGATLNPLERTLHHGGRIVTLTPREVMLVEFLANSREKVVPYELLYNEILGRQFQGDTNNMRVLLAKLCSSAERVGLKLRESVIVVPKTGYRLQAHPSSGT